MTLLPLPFGLIATIVEADDDRPAPPPLAPSSEEHLWLACPCAACVHRRRLAGVPHPPGSVPSSAGVTR
jgi:hypothetical protein